MNEDHASFRRMGAGELDRALLDARARTLALFDVLAGAGYDQAGRVPRLAILNPPLWELGHIAWFAERFVLRAASAGPSLLARGDACFDSNRVAHDARWTLDLPAPDAVKGYCRAVLDGVRARLARTGEDDAALYPFRLALAHEDMHGEALAYTLQTLGVPAPALEANPAAGPPGELAFAGASLLRGGEQARGFVFDNEMQPALYRLEPFAIDAGLVSNAAYLGFVGDGGYRHAQFWSEAGRAWLRESGRMAPRYWRQEEGRWHELRCGRIAALDPAAPVRHVGLHEAQAYCRWAGRRLPLEEEWEHAAASGNAGFGWGALWEWTASRFLPWAGFEAGPYREYSAPSFGRCQVLRGASFATPARLRSPHFRNFYGAGRDDVFAGFRTCAA